MNLSKAKAEYTRFLKIQEKVLSQKTRIKWLEEGDTNSTFFHNVIKDKRKRLTIHKIKDQDGNWVEGTPQVADVAVKFFSHLFKAEHIEEDNYVFYVIERMVTNEDNDNLTSLPTLQKVKDTVFSIDPDSAPGPDGLSGKFYQSAWQIIANDIHAAIISFFQGATLSKIFSHTCIVMLPKVNSPQDFTDFRPISLCNTSSKIIAELINTRLSEILPNIISQNQSGFVRGRAITENVLLAQEIVNDSNKYNFGESWIDLIYRCISNNWYTLLVNGRRHGFFKSGRVLRQGDPLSPSLFVLSAILLSKLLNALYRDPAFIGFSMQSYGPQVNHLSFADDTIIFSSGRKATLQSGNEEGGKYHWISWENLSYPYDERGSNFRKLVDTYKAFKAKQWWKFRTTDSLWTNFLKAKYCRDEHPTTVQWKPGQSHGWKAMLKIRGEMNDKILWKVKKGSTNLWFDNWTNNGSLSDLIEDTLVYQHICIKEVLKQGQWDWKILNPHPPDQIKQIIEKCHLILSPIAEDTPYWTVSESRNFSVSSAWRLLRQKKTFCTY
ncbi:hypothetical protein RDI58_021996 [Solanum bulbocastanum]|uniref:Reverse transcriptase domain-containing protein n=1 Tax=Solanum bulbocastanum TaxID=147425 RepID=A0AAN8T6H4_SOLBU